MKATLIALLALGLLSGCGKPRQSIHDAAYDGNLKVVKQRLDAGTDANARGDDSVGGGGGHTPLFFACQENHKEVAELLISRGANVNAKSGDGWTALHYAAAFASKELVELLIAKGADVNAKTDDGFTPVDSARVSGHQETADLLRKHGGKTEKELKAAGKK